MSNENTEHSMESRPEWDHLEDWLRGQVQGLIQHVLEEEVTGVSWAGRSRRDDRVQLTTVTQATGTGTHRLGG